MQIKTTVRYSWNKMANDNNNINWEGCRAN